MNELTPRQRQALSLDRHLCVTANAGSGKTRVLVERYLDTLLEGHASVREIVALTFTEKAASELRNRIAAELHRLLQGRLPPPRRAVVEEIRSHLAGAWIGTIHSFCGRLLREHPVEAGVDAAFGVLEGLDQRLMMGECIRTAFSRLLEGDDERPARTALIEATRLLGRSTVRALVVRVVEQREIWDRWYGQGGLYAQDDQEVRARWDAAIEDFVGELLAADGLRADLERLATMADGTGAENLRSLWADFLSATDSSGRARTLESILRLALTTSGELARRVAGTAGESLKDVGGRLWQIRKNVLPLLSHVGTGTGAEAHARLLTASRALLEVAAQALAIYAQRKQEAGQLDFEDLQLAARNLLRREEVARSLSERFRYFLVDEFQDTNRLQYEILLPLVQDLQRGNLFIVGDPKQSIYRFRNANVAVFQEARRAITRSSGPDADIVLEESFRPLRDLVAFVNTVFGPVMGSQAEDSSPLTAMEVTYEPLVEARASDHAGRVELLLSDTAEEDGSSIEASLLARRILELRSSTVRISGRDGLARPVEFGDCAILLRNRTVLPEVELALAHHGIPFVVSAGTGYFQTQDVLDFYNFLRVLVDPSDDIALIGVFRSPFFGLSDAELFEACREGRTASLWAHLHAEGAQRSPGLIGALATMDTVRARAATLTVPETIALIVSATMYESKLRGIPGGEQALANLEKLRALARRAHLPGFLTLSDFTERLGQLINQEEHEGQGAIERSGNAVQVMTIHAAKGLEFPVVAVPFLHRPFRLDTPPFVDEYLGIGVAYEDAEGRKTPVPVEVLAREVARRRAIAEEKRVAYVAFTRARDVLLLSGDPSTMRGGENVLAWILRAFSLEASTPAGVIEFPVELDRLSVVDGGFRRDRLKHTLRLVLRRPADVSHAAISSAASHVLSSQPLDLSAPLRPSPVQEFLSATRLRVYRECPRLYYLQYLVGYPGLSPIPVYADRDELSESRAVPGAFGRAFHAVMEAIDRLPQNAEAVRNEASRTLELDKEVAPDQVEPESEGVTRAVMHLLQSSTWQEIMKGTQSRTEFTVSAPLGPDYMIGTMDRIYRDEEGCWTLLDYKTDMVTPAQRADRAASYLPQIQFYALLLAQYFSVPHIRATLLFTVAPEEPLRHEFHAADLERIKEEVLRDMGRIRNREFPPSKPACNQCPFKPGGCDALSS